MAMIVNIPKAITENINSLSLRSNIAAVTINVINNRNKMGTIGI